ncbi:MAG: OmpA family protein [Lishizhenia sp.]
MKVQILTLLVILSSTLVVSAQSGKLKKADNFYNKIAYAEAAELYVDLLGSEVDSPMLKAKLADCYYEMGNTIKAVEYYSAIVNTSTATPEHFYKYASSLRENGNYEESNRWMERFELESKMDSRAIEFANNPDFIQKIKNQKAYFKAEPLTINTKHDEFGGYQIGEQTFFVSNRRAPLLVRYSHTFNGNRFLDLYYANVINENNQLDNVKYQSRKTNTRYHEGPICLSKSGDKIYFTRNNISRGKNRTGEDGIQNLKLYRAERNANDNWANEEELSFNSNNYSTGHPTISPDEKWLYFASNMPGGFGGVDIWRVAINDDGTFGRPQNLGEQINTEGQEMFPWFTEDGQLFFSSDGHLGLGGLDVFAAILKKDYSVQKIINVGEPVNSSKDDFALTLDNKNNRGYFSSNRESGKGGDDIYTIELIQPFVVDLTLKGLITEKGTELIIPGAKVNLKDKNGDIISTVTSNEKGSYSFDLEPDKEYTVEAEKVDYFDNMGQVSTIELPEGTEFVERNIGLEKDPGIALYALIKNAKTSIPLDSVDITITDNITGDNFLVTTTGEKGDFLKGISDKRIGDRISYNISLKKEGYFPKMVTFNHEINKPGIINVNESLFGGLAMDETVKDLAQMITINPINFDLNKYRIRSDAARELDKIVDVMNQYPEMVVELGAHTDCRGSERYNERLSDKRAKASAAYISTKIEKPERIYGKGYGESRILNGCECEGSVRSTCSEDEHEKNRRTEFKVIKTGAEDLKVNNSSTNSFNR